MMEKQTFKCTGIICQIRRSNMKEDYEPFGEEWKRCLKKHPKDFIIDLYKSSCEKLQVAEKDNDSLRETISEWMKMHENVRVQAREFKAANKELLEGLKNITERSKRAQGILRKEIGNEDCWHMLNTDKQFELIKKHDK